MSGSAALIFRRRTLDGCAVLSPSGVLDTGTYAELRAALLKEGTEEVRAVVADLDDLRVERRTALSVFPAVSAQLASWPAIPLILACGRQDLAAVLRDGPIPRFVGTFGSVAAAVAAVALPPPRRRRHVELPGAAEAGDIARRWVRALGAEWELPAHVAASVETVASELVENMVRHARTDGRLRVEQHPWGLAVAVSDGDPTPPRPVGSDATGPSDRGRGIARIAGLASVWGHSPRRPEGKVVWAVLPHPLVAVGNAVRAGDTTAVSLRRGFDRCGLTVAQLWLRYMAMGGSMRQSRLEHALRHGGVPAGEYDLVAHTLNERLAELGLGAVPYRADLSDVDAPDDPA